jgi:DNA-directed RNA polymerase subunit beta
MKKIFLTNTQDLIEIQRASFYKFILYGFYNVMKHIENPIILEDLNKEDLEDIKKTYLKFRTRNSNYKSRKKIQNEENLNSKKFLIFTKISTKNNARVFHKKCQHNLLYRNKTHSLCFFLNVLISKLNATRGTRFFLPFIEIPLLTGDGYFIINGCERIVVNQSLKRPGVYFAKEVDIHKRVFFTGTIISSKNFWTKIFLDEKNPDSPNFKDIIYIPLTSSINSNSFSTYSIKKFENSCKEIFDKKKTKEQKKKTEELKKNLEELKFNYKDFINLCRTYLKVINKISKENKILTKKKNPKLKQFLYSISILNNFNDLNIQEYFDLMPNLKYDFNTFSFDYLNCLFKFNILNSKRFDIGTLGRNFLNQKFLTNLPETYTKLSLNDFANIFNELYKIKYGNANVDEIDHIANKQIRSVGEILENQLVKGIDIFKKAIQYKRILIPIEELYIISNTSKKFRYRPASDRFLGETSNIITLYNYIKNIISVYIKDFFVRSQISQFADQVNPLSTISHKRRISVFGPEGLNRERIDINLRDIHPSQYGKICPIETPEGRNAGLVNTLALYSRVDSYNFLETPYLFTNYSQIFCDKNPIFLNSFLDEKFILSPESFKLFTKKLRLINSTSILVKEHSNFLYQTTDLLNFLSLLPSHILSIGTSMIPFVEHNDGNRALMGANMQRQAVPLLKKQSPIVGVQIEFNVSLDSNFAICSYLEGKVLTSNIKKIQISDFSDQIVTYNLPIIVDTNQYLYSNFNPIVWEGETVFSGEIIANSNSIHKGELALGQNLMVAYMPWEGYNFEDAIVISEKLITKDILTSLHIEEIDIIVEKDLNFLELFYKELHYKENFEFLKINKYLYSSDGILKIGNYVYSNSILIFRYYNSNLLNLSFIKHIFPNYYKSDKNSNLDMKLFEINCNTSIKNPTKVFGKLIDIKIVVNKSKKLCIRFYVVRVSSIEIGDKLSGRHGNKGIISRILPQEDMPFLPDGSTLDLLLNPLGVPSRMNLGQVFECLLGITGEKLGLKYKTISFDEIYYEDASRILINNFLTTTASKLKRSWFFQNYSPGKILLRDGRTGEHFDNTILIGKAYILKLIHLVEDKIHARALGPYSSVTEQPLQGRANNGGQRFGEMEVWALEAHGSTTSLQELLTIKSDNCDARNDIYNCIMNNLYLPMPAIPEAFLVLINELRGLGLNIEFSTQLKDFTNSFYVNFNYHKINIFKHLEFELQLRKIAEVSNNKLLNRI